MQNYTEISEDKTLKDSRALLLDNDKTAMSNNSGTEFPTTNLQPGMLCFRTDLKKFYYLAADGTTWVEIIDVSEDNGWVQRANVADNAEKVNDHTVNADVPVNAKFTDTTYEVATDSQAGLMTAAQKTKLDNLENFSLPVASADTLGGVKIGDGLSISETGLLEATVTGGNATHGNKLFTASGTFTVPDGVSSLVVTAIGGGGGGGGGGGDAAGKGGAGGHGSVTSSVFVPVSAGQSITVIVGAGGSGGAYNSAGGAGGAGDPSGSSGTSGAGPGGSGGSKNGLGGSGGSRGTSNYKGAKGGGGGGGGATSFGDYVYASGGGGGGGANAGGSGGNGAAARPVAADFLLSPTFGAGGSGGSYSCAGATGNAGCVYVRW